MAADSTERIQRALRKQIRPKREEFKPGEKVFFLRDEDWKGPGWIIGKDNVFVIVRYGGTYVHIHESRLLRDMEAHIHESRLLRDMEAHKHESRLLRDMEADIHESRLLRDMEAHIHESRLLRDMEHIYMKVDS